MSKKKDLDKEKPKLDSIPENDSYGDVIDVKTFIQSLPKNKQSIAQQLIIGVASLRQFQGPIPSPESFKEYNQAEPGSARVILDMAKEEQIKRWEMIKYDKTNEWEVEKAEMNHDHSTERRGQWFAFILAFFCIGSSLFAGYLGQTSLSIILASTSLLGLVGAFALKSIPSILNNKEKQSNEDDGINDDK